MQVTILGAGVTGLAIATELTERGVAVEIVDPNPSPGPHSCSWYAGGMLAPFCEGETAEELVSELGREGVPWWAERTAVHQEGSLVVAAARDTAELRRYARATSGHRQVDGDMIAELEPDLGDRFSTGLFFPDEAHMEPRVALERLHNGLRQSGVKVCETRSASEKKDDRHLTIDARGFAARDELTDLRGVKGEMVILRTGEISLKRPVRFLHPRQPIYIVPRDDGTFMVGATQTESEDRSRISARGLVELLNSAYAVHPAFAEAEVVETGSDVRPAFFDNQPRIRRRGDTIYVNGLYRHGFLLAPALARRTAELVLDPAYKMEWIDENFA